MTTEFHSKWLDWKSSKTPSCGTDKTDKSPSVSFVSSTDGGFGQENDRIHCIVLLGESYPDEPDNADPAVGLNIHRDVRAGGGWISIENGKIALRWHGDLPDVGKLIDRIREAREGVVLAAHHEDAEYDRLERDAIQKEADFDNAKPPGDDGGM